jgi:SecD/SecF fusion protein
MKISRIILIAPVLILPLIQGCFHPKAEYEIKAVMEIMEDDIIKELSVDRKDTTLNQAIELALKRRVASRKSFIGLFGEAFAEIDRNRPLAGLFLSWELKDRITYNSTNEDVLKVLEEVIGSAIDNSYNILTDRINKFGIPKRKRKIEIDSNRIFVTIKVSGEDPDRIISLFQPQGKLEFWETYELTDIYEYLLESNNVIRNKLEEDIIAAQSKKKDLKERMQVGQEDAEQSGQQEEELSLLEQLEADTNAVDTQQASSGIEKEYPLFSLLRPRIDNTGNLMRGSAIGWANSKDTAEITRCLNIKEVKALFPKDIKFLWSAYDLKHPETGRHTDLYELHAIRVNSRDGSALLSGDVITKARCNFNRKWKTYDIHLSMNPEGAKRWAIITRNNIGRTIAMVIDNHVYSAPVVQEEIRSGKAMISGNFSIKEAQDLANILNSTAGQKLSGKLEIIKLEVTKPH